MTTARIVATRLLALASLWIVLAACARGSLEIADSTRSRFVAGVDHPYFPLVPRTMLVYESDENGIERREAQLTLSEGREVMGTMCTSVIQQVYVDGVLTEASTEWYAQDREGNVWKFGEIGFEFHGGEPVPAADSWIAGYGDALPWRAFPAHPRPGDRWLGYHAGGTDTYEILAVGETAAVPAGVFNGCLQIIENPEDVEDQDIILYAPNVGRVSEKHSGGRIDLVSVRRL
jgi:hypothetical protein